MRLPLSILLATLLCGTIACPGDGLSGPDNTDAALLVLPRSVSIGIGDTATLSAFFVVSGADSVAAEAEWTSRDTNVATVSSRAVVRGIGSGTTRIVAGATRREDSATVVVTAVALRPPTLQLIAESPAGALVYATAPASDSTRLFLVAQAGAVYVVRNDTLLTAPFLDVRDSVRSAGERGLLSIAFHPAYATNGYFFVSYTDLNNDSRIVRYTATSAETADPASGSLVLALDQPFNNHNGGQVAFGPDGMLYIGFGDGGSGGDPLGSGQNPKSLLGSILRIDVDGGTPYAIPSDNPFVGDAAALPEIWAWGLRNPWRFSFDRLAGDLYIADVGQNAWEEVNVQRASSPGGENYGWNVMEGCHCYAATSCDMQDKILPVIEYSHEEGCSVTGGFVYRGSAVPILTGRYLYADYCSGWVRSFTFEAGRATNVGAWSALAPPGAFVTSFGEDARGELYVMTAAGGLYRIVEAN
ncbi:MAG TPA: PQQ-dependent sugar dehydrogenase [Gemmatimonadales bacterium]